MCVCVCVCVIVVHLKHAMFPEDEGRYKTHIYIHIYERSISTFIIHMHALRMRVGIYVGACKGRRHGVCVGACLDVNHTLFACGDRGYVCLCVRV